jgi:hypothetical protein
MKRPAGLLRDRNLECSDGTDRQRFFALHTVVRSWGLSGAILLDPSLSGFGPFTDIRQPTAIYEGFMCSLSHFSSWLEIIV